MSDFGTMNIAETLRKDWDRQPASKPMTICEQVESRLEKVVEVIIALELRIAELENKKVKK